MPLGPLPAVAKAAKITLHGTLDGVKEWVNAFHLHYSAGGALTLAEVTSIAGAVSAAWIANLSPSLSDTCVLADVEVTALDSSTAPSFTDPVGTAGGAAGQSVPAGTAMVISRKIGRRFRGGHSRVYIPALTAAALNDLETAWDPATAEQIADDWEAIEAAASAAIVGAHADVAQVSISYFSGFTNVLYPSGRYHVQPTRLATPIVDPVTSYVANPRPCSQRRRQQP